MHWLPTIRWVRGFRECRFDVSTSTARIAHDPPDAFVKIHVGHDVVEFGAVLLDIAPGTDQSLLFAGPEHEAQRPPRPHTGSDDGPGGVNHQRGVAAIVERSGAQVPGIQMCAQQNNFLGALPSPDLGDNVALFDRSTDAVRQLEPHPHTPSGGLQACHALCILARHERLRQSIHLSQEIVDVAVEQLVFP